MYRWVFCSRVIRLSLRYGQYRSYNLKHKLNKIYKRVDYLVRKACVEYLYSATLFVFYRLYMLAWSEVEY